MVKLHDFLVAKLILVQWQTYEWVIYCVLLLTRARTELLIPSGESVSFSVSTPARRRQSYESHLPLVALCSRHESEVGIVFPDNRAGFAQILSASAAPFLKSRKTDCPSGQGGFLTGNEERSDALVVLGAASRGGHF